MRVEQVAKRLNFEYCKTTVEDSNTNTKDVDDACKKDTSIISQSSSNETARGVKRKLDFEYELSARSNTRFNATRDTSLQSDQLSPVSRSYVQSLGGRRNALSISSRDKVRKNLFGSRAGSEPTLKRRKLNSSARRLNTLNVSLNKDKLSLHKNFPGVLKGPSSRGQLLLNLAVTKYNTTKETADTNNESPVFKPRTFQSNEKEQMANKNEGSDNDINITQADSKSYECTKLKIGKNDLKPSFSDSAKQATMTHILKSEKHFKYKNRTPTKQFNASFKIFNDNTSSCNMKANNAEMSPVFADISNRCTTKSPKLMFKDIFQKLDLIKDQSFKATPTLTIASENSTSNKIKTRNAKEPVKWIRKDVFSKSMQNTTQSYEGNNNDNTFGKEHLNRFLNDCMNTAKEYSSPISQLKSNKASTDFNSTPLKYKSTLLSNQSPVFTSIKYKKFSDENTTSSPVFKSVTTKNVRKRKHKTEQQKWNELINNPKTPDTKMKGFSIIDETPSTASKDLKVEQISTPVDENEAQNETPFREICDSKNEIDTFDSEKKQRRNKHLTDGLASRINVLKNRERSSVRIWQYESSKRNSSGSKSNIGAIFMVSKMWKERSLYLVKCCTVNEKCEFEENREIILVLSQEQVLPKLASGSVIQIYPPWNIVYMDKLNLTVMICIRKLHIVKKDKKKENNVKEEKEMESIKLCKCEEDNCECRVNNKMNVMWHILSLNDFNEYCSSVFEISDENIHDADGTVRQLLTRRILLPNKYLKLNFKVEHVCNCWMGETNYKCIVGSDKHSEYCRILMEENGGQDLSNVNDKHIAIEGIALINDQIIKRSCCTYCAKEWKIWSFLFNYEYGNWSIINNKL